MKKMIVLFLCLLLAVSVSSYSFAQDEQPGITPTDVTNTDVSTTLKLVKQLRENPAVEDIWVPVFSDDYQIQSVTVTPNGSYYFVVVPSEEDSLVSTMRVSVIVNDAITGSADKLSPYQMYLLENMQTPLELSSELLDTILKNEFVNDGKLVYAYIGEGSVGHYDNYMAASFLWAYAQQGDMDGILLYSGNIQETVFALTPKVMASVVHEPLTVEQDILTDLQNRVGLAFTTYGDVDGNTKVEAKDALAILKHAVQKQPITDELSLLLADCNTDDTIDANDALYTLRKAVFK